MMWNLVAEMDTDSFVTLSHALGPRRTPEFAFGDGSLELVDFLSEPENFLSCAFVRREVAPYPAYPRSDLH